MADIADLAADREAGNLADALAKQARKSGFIGKTITDSAIECDCGELIPKGRRQALPGVQTCIECQMMIEKQEKRWTEIL